MRDVVKQPGISKASKFRIASSGGESAEYWTIYELESLGAFEKYDKSQAAKELRDDHQARFGHATKLERFVLLKTFDTTGTRRSDSGRGSE